MVFIVCVRFHENMSSGFKVMERTRKLLTDTHTHTHTDKRRKHYTPIWRGYNNEKAMSNALKHTEITKILANSAKVYRL